ncbi:MAG: NAD(P)-dependent oxidoreductase [Candidatus Shapirobacteria bacterium]|nr:NAD(P)-dependent oxidoreductase [Candidatus Shapirobacteria bacterium]
MNKPKIVGTGLSGLVGSRITELLKNDFEFVDFSLATNVNILDPEALETAFASHQDAVAILHMAAFTDTNGAWAQKDDQNGLCYQLNVTGTQNILDLSKKYNKYLIYISTDFVFDGNKEGSYTEEDTPNPIEWYGQTKYLGEKLILDSNYKAAVVRIAFPYRAEFDEKKDLVRKLIDGLKAGTLNPLFADQITTTTFIDDIAYGLKLFFETQPQGTYHLVGSSSQSPYDLAQKIAEVFELDQNLVKKGSLEEYVKTLPAGSRPWQKNLALSNQKVQSLGIKMRTLSEGLEEMKRQLGL